MRTLILACALLLSSELIASKSGQKNPLVEIKSMPNASLLFEVDGKPHVAQRKDKLMVPASTLKLLTALVALEKLGRDFRFKTDFFIDKHNNLFVKGFGDPYMVSEEVDLIVAVLKVRGLEEVNNIYLDTSFYEPDIHIDGRSTTDNPYDAPVAALNINFNTIALKRVKGVVVKAESQTPVTAITRKIAATKVSKNGRNRVNLQTGKRAERYFGQVLMAKLKRLGIPTKGKISHQNVASDLPLLYRHENSRELASVIKLMLASSNNLIANTLYLHLDPAPQKSMAGATKAIRQWIKLHFDWEDYNIVEGSGLSRKNKLSASQMLEVIKAFRPHLRLMRTYLQGRVRAKTGTLRGVSCLAGFVKHKKQWQPFVLLVNQSVSRSFRIRLARKLSQL